MMDQDKKDPGLAAVFSFIFNGLGQIYNGQIFKGLSIVFFSVISIVGFIIGGVFTGYWLLEKVLFKGQLACGIILLIVNLIFICLIAIYSIMDAYRTAAGK